MGLSLLASSCGGGAGKQHAGAAQSPPVKRSVKPEFARIEPSSGGQVEAPAGLQLLEAETQRAMQALKSQGELAPYFIGNALLGYDAVQVSASNGAILTSNRSKLRTLTTDVRVGSHDLDSTHPLGGYAMMGVAFPEFGPLSDDGVDALKRLTWRLIDRGYRDAAERFLAIKAETNVKVGIEDRSGDFSREKPVRFIGPPAPAPNVALPEWEARLRRLSSRFREHAHLHDSDVSLDGHTLTRWIVNTEGTRVQTGESSYRISISADTRAEDGMYLARNEIFTSARLEGLPNEAELAAAADRVSAELAALRAAPPAEPFVGPAILLGRAAGVFFHETFGHRVEGERQKFEEEGQTFAKKLGERVLPEFIDVYDDPSLARLGAIDLNGFYRFDDEGVPAQRASLVERGVLKDFLRSRVPVRGVAKSNGHGRRLSGNAMARQANLVVESHESVTLPELRALLVAEAKRQKKRYGLLFAEIEGGFTETTRESTQGFKVMPVLVYRVWTDGRKDELIRGVDIIGTPLTSLTKILAAGDDYAVFNGSCGAESGWVPVSAISPSLLVQQIEVALRDKENEKPPVLPPPEQKGGEK